MSNSDFSERDFSVHTSNESLASPPSTAHEDAKRAYIGAFLKEYVYHRDRARRTFTPAPQPVSKTETFAELVEDYVKSQAISGRPEPESFLLPLGGSARWAWMHLLKLGLIDPTPPRNYVDGHPPTIKGCWEVIDRANAAGWTIDESIVNVIRPEDWVNLVKAVRHYAATRCTPEGDPLDPDDDAPLPFLPCISPEESFRRACEQEKPFRQIDGGANLAFRIEEALIERITEALRFIKPGRKAKRCRGRARRVWHALRRTPGLYRADARKLLAEWVGVGVDAFVEFFEPVDPVKPDDAQAGLPGVEVEIQSGEPGYFDLKILFAEARKHGWDPEPEETFPPEADHSEVEADFTGFIPERILHWQRCREAWEFECARRQKLTPEQRAEENGDVNLKREAQAAARKKANYA